MQYYHASNKIFNQGDILLPPIFTKNLRESWRNKNLDVVFCTNSLHSAKKYAKKMNGIVYVVAPINLNPTHGNEFICDKAVILNMI